MLPYCNDNLKFYFVDSTNLFFYVSVDAQSIWATVSIDFEGLKGTVVCELSTIYHAQSNLDFFFDEKDSDKFVFTNTEHSNINDGKQWIGKGLLEEDEISLIDGQAGRIKSFMHLILLKVIFT